MSGAARAISIEGLEHRYAEGDFRLEVASLAIERGERVACIGPSGSGKTTFLHLLAGILPVRAGRVRVGGFEVSSAGDDARRAFRIAEIGLVFQELALLDHLDVRENALLPYFVNPTLALDAAAERALEALARVLGIEGLLGRRPRELSQGERQRVALCRALVTHPSVILADEPTGNLDPRTGARVVELLLESARDRGATLLFVTHDHDVLGCFDRVIDFRSGVPTFAGGAR